MSGGKPLQTIARSGPPVGAAFSNINKPNSVVDVIVEKCTGRKGMILVFLWPLCYPRTIKPEPLAVRVFEVQP